MGLRRETCKVCWRVNSVGFTVPDEIWLSAVPEQLQNSVLCVYCFAYFADEANIRWDAYISFFPVSAVSHRRKLACLSETETKIMSSVADCSRDDS